MSPRERAAEEAVSAVSFDIEDAMSAVGVGPGPAKVMDAYFTMAKYADGKTFPACAVEYERGGSMLPAENYTIGGGWSIGKDGQTIIPRAAQTGFPENCKFMQLIASLRELGMPKGFIKKPADLIGIEGVLIKKETVFADRKKKDGDKDKKDAPGSMTAMVFEEVTDAPWVSGSTTKGRTRAAEPEEDEAPRRGRAAKEEPAPTRRGRQPEPEPEESADADAEEVAGEALMDALKDGDLKLRQVEAAVEDVLVKMKIKGKTAEPMLELVTSEKFLKKQLGWKFDGKTVSLK